MQGSVQDASEVFRMLRARPSSPPRRAAAVAASVCLLLGTPAAAVEEGEAAPAFDAPLLDGEGTVSLAQHRGKIVYLDFWASWCAPCVVSLPLLEQLRAEFPPDRFQIVAVNLDRDSSKARRFLKKRKIGYPSAADPEGEIPGRFDVQTMPTSYLIDGQGIVRHVHAGFRKGDLPQLRERIRSMLAGTSASR